jgi:hypothetical protein
MFQSISWTEFLTAIFILGVLYYAAAGTVLYQNEIKSFFTDGFQKKSEGETQQRGDSSFIGGAVQRQDTDEVPDEELQFAPVKTSAPIEHLTAATDMNLVGTVADLGEDIKRISGALPGLSRDEIRDNFTKLLRQYVKLAPTSYRSTINMLISETISEKTALKININEIDRWW